MSFASALVLTPLLAFAAPAVAFLDEEPASGQQEPVSEPQDPAEMPAVLAVRDTLQDAARARGYAWVTLDLAGYRTGGGTSRPKSS